MPNSKPITTITDTEKQFIKDDEGNITGENIKEKQRTYASAKNTEPDFIKIYTKMWCEFKGVPAIYRQLFLSIACRMSFCNKDDLEHSQIVHVTGSDRQAIMAECGWKDKSMVARGLQELCKCGALRKMERGVYQVNPQYAGRGLWKYNPNVHDGGIEDLVAKFNFKDGTNETEITYKNDMKEESYGYTMPSDNPNRVEDVCELIASDGENEITHTRSTEYDVEYEEERLY